MIKTNRLTTSKPGVIKVHPGNTSTIPNGYLLCNGQEVPKATYPQLWASIGIIYGTAVNPLNVKLPDLRGEFVRGADFGRGLDPGRAVGTFQVDDFQSHGHSYTIYDQPPNLGGSIGGGPVTVDSQLTTATGDGETRPVNTAMNFIIKV